MLSSNCEKYLATCAGKNYLDRFLLYILSSLLKILPFQKLVYNIRIMFAIVEKMISLASFDVTLAHVRT